MEHTVYMYTYCTAVLCTAAGQGGTGAARGAAAADLAGETTQQLISFELELLDHADHGPGRAPGEWSCRSGSSAAADLAHRQASRWTPVFARCCVLTQRERAGLDTIINTTTGPPARSCVHPKYVNMSVLYECEFEEQGVGLARRALSAAP